MCDDSKGTGGGVYYILYYIYRVPANKELLAGTLPANRLFLNFVDVSLIFVFSLILKLMHVIQSVINLKTPHPINFFL